MQTAYTNVSEFAYLPGQVILMLALENTNNLITYDIDEALKSFEVLKLILYPGENVGDLVKDCLKFLHIMDGRYCLPYNVQSTFLYKMNNTNSSNFNFQVSALLQKVLAMEDSISQHKNPKDIMRHPSYTQHNVWALCDAVAATYRQEVGFNRWIVERLPPATDVTKENPGGKSCWDCGSFFHLCNSPIVQCMVHLVKVLIASSLQDLEEDEEVAIMATKTNPALMAMVLRTRSPNSTNPLLHGVLFIRRISTPVSLLMGTSINSAPNVYTVELTRSVSIPLALAYILQPYIDPVPVTPADQFFFNALDHL